MLHTTPLFRFRISACISVVMGAALLAGCAQQRPDGYFDTPRESTLGDAQKQAQGHRGSRAPSQLQLGFGETEEERRQAQARAEADNDAQSDSRAQARPLLQPKTFLGTVPCLTGDAGCPASRVTLTFAPGGEWRARTELLGTANPQQPLVQQGCWHITGTDPLRISLRTNDEATKASFAFANDNLLRVTTFNDVRPTLDYHLTRQADIDPIDELAGQPAMHCD